MASDVVTEIDVLTNLEDQLTEEDDPGQELSDTLRELNERMNRMTPGERAYVVIKAYQKINVKPDISDYIGDRNGYEESMQSYHRSEESFLNWYLHPKNLDAIIEACNRMTREEANNPQPKKEEGLPLSLKRRLKGFPEYDSEYAASRRKYETAEEDSMEILLQSGDA